MNRERYRSAFGAALDRQLVAKRVTQARLAETLSVTQPYVSNAMRGSTAVSPTLADSIAEALKLTDEERIELHRAAARDRGYKIE